MVLARFSVIALLAVAAMVSADTPVAAPAAPAADAADAKKPIIVAPGTLSAAAAPAAPSPAADTKATKPALPAAYTTEVDRLEKSIKDHQESLETLQKQLDDGLKQKQRLILAQKLMTSIIALHKAERVLADLDKVVHEAKHNIKKFGDKAEEISETIKRSETDHKKELVDLNGKLTDLKKDLQAQEDKLKGLLARRERVAGTVSRWRAHVATLRDAHDAASKIASGKKHVALDPYDVPEPPITVPFYSGPSSPLRRRVHAPHVDALINGAPAEATAVKAVNDVASLTAKALGANRFSADMDAAMEASEALPEPSHEDENMAEQLRFRATRNEDDLRRNDDELRSARNEDDLRRNDDEMRAARNDDELRGARNEDELRY